MNYEHTQKGIFLRLVAFGGAAITVGMALSNGSAAMFAVAAFLALVGFLFHCLTVKVGSDVLEVRFGIGLVKFKFPLRDIRECRRVRNSWWYGWGIRLTPHGWLYNISGFDAVEIVMANGRKYRIGTDEPNRLIEALQ